jgi:hypothetical protein
MKIYSHWNVKTLATASWEKYKFMFGSIGCIINM